MPAKGKTDIAIEVAIGGAEEITVSVRGTKEEQERSVSKVFTVLELPKADMNKEVFAMLERLAEALNRIQ